MQGYDLQKKSKELAVLLDEYIKHNFEPLTAKFLDCFLAYCEKISQMQEQGEKGAIAYLHFSVLKTNILLKKHEIRMDAYDENWYLDSVECSGSYPVEEFYSYLECYGDIVEDLRRKSGGTVSLTEAQRRVFEESNLYLFYIAEMIRVGMRKAVREEAYQKVLRAPCFTVCIGGFLDRFDILYKEDRTQKDSAEVKRYLQSGNKKVFRYEICENLDLSEGNYEGLEFQYASFAGCDFTKSSWEKSKLVFGNFQNTVFTDAKMEKTKIFDTDFSGAKLERVSFAGAKLKYISFANATLCRVDFSKALLAEEIDFKGARMIECRLP